MEIIFHFLEKNRCTVYNNQCFSFSFFLKDCVGGMKKLVNFVLILIFVLNNIFTPFSYAIENQWSIVLEEIPSIETSDGNSSESTETSDEEIPSESEMSDDTPSEDTDISDDLSSEDKETTSEDIDTTDEIIPADIPEENSTWTEVDIPTTWTDTQTSHDEISKIIHEQK